MIKKQISQFSFFAFIAFSSFSCVRGGSTPQDSLRVYQTALDTGDQEAAWNLMSPAYQARTSNERFELEFDRRMEDRDALINELHSAVSSDASLNASLSFSRHETITLGFIDGQWQITSGVANFYDRSTPQLALIAFINAIENSNTEELLLLVPSEYRIQMDLDDLDRWLIDEADALNETITLLRANADAPITEANGTAILRYGNQEMRFIQEGLDWKIEDF